MLDISALGTGRRFRDAALFAAGALATSACLVLWNVGQRLAEPCDREGSGAGSSAGGHLSLDKKDQRAMSIMTQPLGTSGALAADRTVVEGGVAATAAPEKEEGPAGPYAYVQLVYDPPGSPPRQLWRAVATARALQRVSKYPLVILANTTQLSDDGGITLRSRLRRLNVLLRPLQAVPPPRQTFERMSRARQLEYWRLQVWSLTEFRRVIWLDADTAIFRSLDALFTRPAVWGVLADSSDGTGGGQALLERKKGCAPSDLMRKPGGEDFGFLGDGLLLLEPNRTIFEGLQEYGGTLALDWWRHGVSRLIQNYFKFVLGQPVRFLEPLDISSAECLGKADALPLEEEGPWNMPAVVHGVADRSECFDYNWSAQLATDDKGNIVNVCHFHPLGPWWRSLFCPGMNMTGLGDGTTQVFCTDSIWYNTSGPR